MPGAATKPAESKIQRDLRVIGEIAWSKPQPRMYSPARPAGLMVNYATAPPGKPFMVLFRYNNGINASVEGSTLHEALRRARAVAEAGTGGFMEDTA